MDKKSERLSFRTTEPYAQYLKELADSDERSISFVINKMITYFKDKSISNVRDIK